MNIQQFFQQIRTLKLDKLAGAIASALTFTVTSTVAGPEPSGGDDTSAINTLTSTLSALTGSFQTGQYTTIRFKPGTRYSAKGLIPASNICWDFRDCEIYSSVDGTDLSGTSTSLQNSLVRTQDVATALTGGAAITLTFTANPASGATTATLSSAWAGTDYAPPVIFPNGDVRNVQLTPGSTAVFWTYALQSNCSSATASVATYYGRYQNFKILGGLFCSNGKSHPAQIMRLHHIQDLVLERVKVKHTTQTTGSWAFDIRAQNFDIRKCRVLNGSQILQDGFHVEGGYGAITDCRSRSGDDGYAFGMDHSGNNGVELCDDEPIGPINVNGCVIDAQYGSIKAYYGQNQTTGQCFAGSYRGRLDGVTIVGMTGNAGVMRNGGVYIKDESTIKFTAGLSSGASSGTLAQPWPGDTGTYYVIFSNGDKRSVTLTRGSATTGAFSSTLSSAATQTASCVYPARVKGVDINVNITAGSTSNDGVNSAGVYVFGAMDPKVSGRIKIIDTTLGSKFSFMDVNWCDGGDFSVSCPQLPAFQGAAVKNSRNLRLHHMTTRGGGGSGRGIVECTGVLNLMVDHFTATDLPTSTSMYINLGTGSGLFPNVATFDHFNGTKVSGATSTRALTVNNPAAGQQTYISATDCDWRGGSNAQALDASWNSNVYTGSGSFSPDVAVFRNNRGTIPTAFCVDYAASTTVPAVVGAKISIGTRISGTGTAVPISADITLVPPAINTVPIGEYIDVELALDAFASGTRNVTFGTNAGSQGWIVAGTWTQAVVTTDANKKCRFRALYDGANYIIMGSNKWV